MIFFDIDGTLMDNEAAERAAAVEFHRFHRGVFPESPEEFVDSWRATAEKYVRRYLSGELSFQGQRQERLKELFAHIRHLSDTEADSLFEAYLDCYEKSWSLFSDVESCLERITGFGLGIISNGDSYQQRQKLTALGLIDRFSVITISGEVGVSKPNPQIFLDACRAAGANPADCWHIGDDLETDVHGCISAGIRGIWLNRRGMGSCEGVPMIRSLLELKAVIGSYNQSEHPIAQTAGSG
ncbi:MAG: HAD family hydrolase [Deltaproteobacteria bacterium HGW-Deltaproteobacteria-21]|nr:MAG: HAD family hydrolase [Deltaproteobacteria bacterium HGW-Deltaproteobacteria-21]